MSYAAAIDALNALAPELYAQPGRPRRKFSLAEIATLLGALDNPHHSFKSVLIAGTNGKGSTAATLASIAAAAGLRTGLYTSPHLERPNERIRISDASSSLPEISDVDFARRYFTVHDTAERLVTSGELAQHPSFFETLTAMAFFHFAEARVDVAILEVGLGGRLDATNIVDPLLSIITDISLDHMEWLGPTVAAIAREKAGILRPNGTLMTLPQHPEANQSIGEAATGLNVRAISAAPFMPAAHAAPDAPYAVDVLGQTIQIDSPLQGAHQHRNVALAIAAAAELAQHHGFPITPASIAAGIHSTRWPGRLEQIRIGPALWVLDVAHNPAGAWALRAALRPILDSPAEHCRTLVFSCLRDKPIDELAAVLFPLFDRVIFAPIHSLRAASMESLLAAAATTGTPAQAAESVAAALELARPATSVATTFNLARPVASLKGHDVYRPAAQPASLKGHDFSRADEAAEMNPALAAEGRLSSVAQAEDSAAPTALIVVSGSVYLVGEARSILLRESGCAPSISQHPREMGGTDDGGVHG